MKVFDEVKYFSEEDILKVAEKYLNEVALHSLLKTGLMGDISIGIGICMTHIIQDLGMNTIEAEKLVDEYQIELFKNYKKYDRRRVA